MGFKLIYWTPTFVLFLKNLEKSVRQLRPDWGNTARTGTAGLGSNGLN